MRCPKCASDTVFVLETRQRQDGVTRRRRSCRVCGLRFTTYEDVLGDHHVDPAWDTLGGSSE